jgi:hypothetical protein
VGNVSTVAGLVATPRRVSRLYRVSMGSGANIRWHNFAYGATISIADRAYPPVITAPGSAAGSTYDNTSAGALPLPSVTGGQKIYLSRARVYALDASQSSWTFILFDRLWACSTLVGNVITAQTVSSVGLPARITDNGVGVEAWVTTWTAAGSTATIPSISYTNPGGTAGRSSAAFPTAQSSILSAAGAGVPFGYQSGDSGIKSIESFTLSVSTGTAGNLGLIMGKRIATIPTPRTPGLQAAPDWMDLGLVEIPPAAFLDGMMSPNGPTSFVVELEMIVA